jgi:glycosyltransferase involved in cell wall biosynthesis
VTEPSTRSSNPPLLSICIPTYKGAEFLRVSLEALLPQVAEAGGRVEVLVIDDLSPDNTAEAVEEARRFGPVRYVRNPANLGSARNIVRGPLEYATGEFLWIWSQHCLVYPGALRKLLGIMETNRDVGAFYVNFRCAKFPDQWPRQAPAGYDGEYQYLSNSCQSNREVARWEELLDAQTCVGTQSYVHVFKRTIWLNYWSGVTLGANFEDAPATYPTTCAVARHMFGKPGYYIGEPVLTIFNGAQWWGTVQYRVRAYMRGYPDLLRLYRRLGWPGHKLREAEAWGMVAAGDVMVHLFRDWRWEEGRLLVRYLIKCWYYPGLIRETWRAFLQSECCWLARGMTGLGRQAEKWHRYWLHNCRPARWIRARLQPR